MMILVLFLIGLSVCSGGFPPPVPAMYKVVATREHQEVPILSRTLHTSEFDFTYNAAAVSTSNGVQLFVRCQNRNGTTGNNTPSQIALVELQGDGTTGQLTQPELTKANIVFHAQGEAEAFGTEDPRVLVVNGTYYMLYSAVSASPAVISRLSLATSTTPQDPSSWVRHGEVVPQRKWSKSGALIVRPNILPHLLFWGDSADNCGLHIAESMDLLNYDDTDDQILLCRPDHFDTDLIEAGPPPLPLADGNLFFIYNSAQRINATSMVYNIGWAVLHKDNPRQVLARSDVPLLSPTLDWEVNGLVPHVVFCEGMWALSEPNTFAIVYGGADTCLGLAFVNVTRTV